MRDARVVGMCKGNMLGPKKIFSESQNPAGSTHSCSPLSFPRALSCYLPAGTLPKIQLSLENSAWQYPRAHNEEAAGPNETQRKHGSLTRKEAEQGEDAAGN